MEKTNTITIDTDGNAETNLENIDEAADLLNRTVTLTVRAQTGNSVGQLTRVKDLLDSIKSKTVTVTTK